METGRNKHCCLLKKDRFVLDPLFEKIYEIIPDRYFGLLTEALIKICPHAFDFMHISMEDSRDESFYREIDQHFAKYPYDFVISLDYLIFDEIINTESDDKEDGFAWIDLVEKEMPGYFSEQERDIIKSNTEITHLSLFEVLDVNPGKSILMKDLFTQEEFNIIERSASREIQKYDCLLARVLIYNNNHYFSSVVMPVPRRDYKCIVDYVNNYYKKEYKKLMNLKTFLKAFSSLLVEIIQECYKQNRKKKIMTTTGEEMLFCSAVYEILNYSPLTEKLNSIEEFDLTEQDIARKSIRYQWFGGTVDGKKSSPETNKILNVNKSHLTKGPTGNVTLGNIQIENNILTAECNSEKRMKRLKDMLNTHAKDMLRLKSEDVKTINEMMSRRGKEKKPSEKSEDIPLEIRQEIMNNFSVEHYTKLFTEKIPTLGNKSPKKCLKTMKGKKMVYELLKEYENMELHKKAAGQVWFDIRKIYKLWRLTIPE